MKHPETTDQPKTAFSLIELLTAAAILALLAALLVPCIQSAKERTKRISCLSQLRQIGIASLAFAGDHGDRLPGTIPHAIGDLSPLHVLVPYVVTPLLFVCPSDPERSVGTGFMLNRTNTSYFVSYSAQTDLPKSILAGDRNVTMVHREISGLPPFRITGTPQLKHNDRLGWWHDIHRLRGNILLADGSVHLTQARELTARAADQGLSLFVWYVPNGEVIFTPIPHDAVFTNSFQ